MANKNCQPPVPGTGIGEVLLGRGQSVGKVGLVYHRSPWRVKWKQGILDRGGMGNVICLKGGFRSIKMANPGEPLELEILHFVFLRCNASTHQELTRERNVSIRIYLQIEEMHNVRGGKGVREDSLSISPSSMASLTSLGDFPST